MLLLNNVLNNVVALVKDIIAPVDNYIRVRGYTDNEGIRNEMFRSNWELSVARATSVLVELEELGINQLAWPLRDMVNTHPFLVMRQSKGVQKP